MIPKSFDILGNIAILKFDKEKKSKKIKIAKELLKKHNSITTVLEKSEKIKGRLRKIKTVHLAGEKTKIARYVENGCKFKFNVDETYFSQRLSNERKEIAEQVKKNERVLVMFAGVGVFAIVIGKLAKPKLVISNEINRKASKFAKENVKLNKLKNVKIVQGDSKRICEKFFNDGIKFDRIVMPRPNLRESFLKSALKVIKKKGIVNYYGFGGDVEKIVFGIREEVKRTGKKIKIKLIKKAGDIAPYKFRWRVDFIVL